MKIGAAVSTGIVLLALSSVGIVRSQAQEPPKGWYRAGMNPDDYVMSVDPKGGRTGDPCAFIKAKTAEARTFGTLMQTFAADEY